jgi:hypothetical protein
MSIGSLPTEAALPVATGSVPWREGSSGKRADTGTQLAADFHQRMPKRTRSLTLGALIGLGHYRTRPPVRYHAPAILELMLSEKLREYGVVGAGGAGYQPT